MDETCRKERLFLGGLAKDVTPDDLKSRFSRFGTISSVDVIREVHDDLSSPCKGFAYLDMTGEVDKCIRAYNRTKWGGRVVRIEKAKPDYLERIKLVKEDEENRKVEPTANKKVKGTVLRQSRVENWKRNDVRKKVAKLHLLEDDVHGKKKVFSAAEADAVISSSSESDDDDASSNSSNSSKATPTGVAMDNSGNESDVESNESSGNESDIESGSGDSSGNESDDESGATDESSPSPSSNSGEGAAGSGNESDDEMGESGGKEEEEEEVIGEENRKNKASTDDDDDDSELKGDTKAKQKITFDSDGEEMEVVPTEQFPKRKTLGLFDDDDEDDDDDDIDNFAVKKVFEGKKGKKLLELQGRVVDPRFRFDDRFAESESEGEGSENENKKRISLDSDDDNEKDINLAEEKSKALSVLASILPDDEKYIRTDDNRKGKSDTSNIGRDHSRIAVDARAKIGDVIQKRYDPTADNATEFEVKQDESSDEDMPPPPQEREKGEEEEKREPNTERFFEITGEKTSLRSLFGFKSSDQEVPEPQPKWTLLGGDAETKSEAPKESTGGSTWTLFGNKDTAGDGDGDGGGDGDATMADSYEDDANGAGSKATAITAWTIADAFHTIDEDDKDESNDFASERESGVDIGRMFMRMKSEEEVKEDWMEKRQTLTDDFKRKHKDALRRKVTTNRKRVKVGGPGR